MSDTNAKKRCNKTDIIYKINHNKFEGYEIGNILNFYSRAHPAYVQLRIVITNF
jgi:hypothetical protein